MGHHRASPPSLVFRLAVALAPSLALLACAGASDPGVTSKEGARVAVAVAPLTLPGLTNACYNLRVDNGHGQTVWSKTGVCADDYGDGAGAVSYVGPCDASAGETQNHVILEVAALYAGSTTPLAADRWQNPCPVGAEQCAKPLTCKENQDVGVSFDITIMRAADQGFFDVAVNFDDIFCSAKLDCLAEPFLHRPGGGRDSTAVFGFACTTGETGGTTLHLSDLTISCSDGTRLAVDPTDGPGNGGAVGSILFEHATYRGKEAIGGAAFDKCYWNTALGVDDVEIAKHGTCTLSVHGTASKGAFAGGFSPADTRWAYVDASVPLNPGGGAMSCGSHGLDDSAQVATRYTPFDGPSHFDHFMTCATEAVGDYPPAPEWAVGGIEVVSYDRETGALTLRDATRTSLGNRVVSSSWEVVDSAYVGSAFPTLALTDQTSPRTGTRATFTVTSRSGAYGYSGCAQPVGLPSAITAVYSSLTRLTIPGIYVNQTYYPFAAPIDAISGGVVHEVDAAVAAEIDLALTAAGVPHGAVGTNTGLPAVFAQLTGLGPVAGGDRYPTITPIWTVDPPLQDYGATMITTYAEPAASNCQVDGAVEGVDQGFNVRLTSTDAYGRSVVSQALVFLDPFDVGALVPGATLAPSGTSVTVTAAPGAALDYESPYTVYDTFSLDTDRDGVAETTNATGSFSYDAGAAGLETGRLSFDDQPWWWLDANEVYSDYYFVAR